MNTLSVHQPWAWLIVHGWKDVENRDWPTAIRGRVLIHASKGMTRDEYLEARDDTLRNRGSLVGFPAFDQLERGGIVGSVNLVDCVTIHGSRWFYGMYGFVLCQPLPCPFVPCRGRLGFFEAAA